MLKSSFPGLKKRWRWMGRSHRSTIEGLGTFFSSTGREELLHRLPKEGFLKITAAKPADPTKLAEGERVALIRKGNELFNQKKLELARKIFITTGYSDGLIRLGDEYIKQAKPLELSLARDSFKSIEERLRRENGEEHKSHDN
jgi:hypothetical protein